MSAYLQAAGREVGWSCIEEWRHVEQNVNCRNEVKLLNQRRQMLDAFRTELTISAPSTDIHSADQPVSYTHLTLPTILRV